MPPVRATISTTAAKATATSPTVTRVRLIAQTLPSPSLGPPLLSASASPALGPCGIPLELEPGDVDEGGGVAVVPDGLDECVDGFADGVDGLEEFEPHAVAPSAANARRTAAKRRCDRVAIMFMIAPLLGAGGPGSLVRSCLDARKQCAGALGW